MTREIPRDLAKRMANWIRGATHITHPARFIDFKEIIRDLDTLSAPKDPAEVAARRIHERIIEWSNTGPPCPGNAWKTIAQDFRETYAEREEAVKALLDTAENMPKGDDNRPRHHNGTERDECVLCREIDNVRRLYGWDREGNP